MKEKYGHPLISVEEIANDEPNLIGDRTGNGAVATRRGILALCHDGDYDSPYSIVHELAHLVLNEWTDETAVQRKQAELALELSNDFERAKATPDEHRTPAMQRLVWG